MSEFAIIAGDAHIDGNETTYKPLSVFNDYVQFVRPGKLIFNGDWGDPWRRPWSQILKCDSWRLIWELCAKRKVLFLNNEWVLGNHDWDAEPEYLPANIHRKEYKFDWFTVMHGWQFDISWNIIHPAAFFIAIHWPQLMIPIYKTLYQNKLKTPGAQKRTSKGVLWEDAQYEWNQHVGIIHLRARAYAKKKGKNLIINHTHCDSRFDGLIADSGDMRHDFTFIEVKDRVVTVMEIIGNDVKPVSYRR